MLGRLHGPYARDNNVHREANQIGGEVREPFVSSLCPSVFDANVAPFVVAEFTKALPKRVEEGIRRRAGTKDPDARDLPRRLRVGDERRREEAHGTH